MERLWDLTISSSSLPLPELVWLLARKATGGWRRDRGREKAERGLGGLEPGYCFLLQSAQAHPPVALWLEKRSPRSLRVRNIVRQEMGKLSVQQYNSILDSFRRDVVRPAAGHEHRIRCSVSKRLPKMPPVIGRYYRAWINTPALLGHPGDEERFYKFVKACVHYGNKNKRRGGGWLRKYLQEDLVGKFEQAYLESTIAEAESLFDHLLEYEKVRFPDPLVEMRQPLAVMAELSRWVREDGSRLQSDEEIEAFLTRNFGPDWRRRRR